MSALRGIGATPLRPEATGEFDLSPEAGGARTAIPAPESSDSERALPERGHRPSPQRPTERPDDVGQAVVAALGCGFAGGVFLTLAASLLLQGLL